jgi:hypothetical protein
MIGAAKDLKGARYALWKNPENLTDRQTRKLASIQKTNRRLYRAYLLKEQLRQIYRLPAGQAIRMCCALWSVMTVLLAWRVDLLLGGCECARPRSRTSARAR